MLRKRRDVVHFSRLLREAEAVVTLLARSCPRLEAMIHVLECMDHVQLYERLVVEAADSLGGERLRIARTEEECHNAAVGRSMPVIGDLFAAPNVSNYVRGCKLTVKIYTKRAREAIDSLVDDGTLVLHRGLVWYVAHEAPELPI
ncbi:MAG: hypothetical protein JWN01_852 [Patescibacteria group bacterium]|nr:hypothetical protein [Patescibacteria group bacterium]